MRSFALMSSWNDIPNKAARERILLHNKQTDKLDQKKEKKKPLCLIINQQKYLKNCQVLSYFSQSINSRHLLFTFTFWPWHYQNSQLRHKTQACLVLMWFGNMFTVDFLDLSITQMFHWGKSPINESPTVLSNNWHVWKCIAVRYINVISCLVKYQEKKKKKDPFSGKPRASLALPQILRK